MSLKSVPLESLHQTLGAKLVPFAGYNMPVQYPTGIIKEHLHTRTAAGLFDVSHMGQVVVSGEGAVSALEALMPADLEGLAVNAQTYSLLTNEAGGVIDDLIVTRWAEDQFMLVINAGCKDKDLEHLRSHLASVNLEVLSQHSLLALQGPKARAVMNDLLPETQNLVFMTGTWAQFDGEEVYVTCSGYTGEDGFEISVPNSHVEALAQKLLAHADVLPIGLGARDSLRLEAGLCLYGHELEENISPIQAGLKWAIAKARRHEGARAGGYLGSTIIEAQWAEGTDTVRVGLKVLGKRPVREGAAVFDAQQRQVGTVCSGGFGATLEQPVAMAYVSAETAALGTVLFADVRGKLVDVEVAKTPFVAQRYFRG
ncbi:glycine cleavage system aminomethyltransferase GcvT [Aequoribacter sp.]|uniref:glycine cleavage system aminomethyltransferase GcvT n=1 Tax=Aequoribacter sp. TaxID=2847771 RepID=UPI003F69E6E0